MRDEGVIAKDRGRGWFIPEFSIDLFVSVRVGDQTRQFLRGGDESQCRVGVRG